MLIVWYRVFGDFFYFVFRGLFVYCGYEFLEREGRRRGRWGFRLKGSYEFLVALVGFEGFVVFG